jgi:hypothetical protein
MKRRYSKKFYEGTSVLYKGGVVRVIDSATGDIARTTSGWIEDEKYGWYAQRKTSSISAKIDNSVLYKGHKTIKIETTSDTGTVYLSLVDGEGGNAGNSKHLLPVKPSTEYKVSVVVKGENITNLSFVWQGHTALFSRINYTTATSKNGTYDFSLVEYTFTTQSTAVFLNLMFRIDVAGNGQKAWIAPYSLKLEEVSTITNSSPYPVDFYPTFKAVSSKDNIDQSNISGTLDTFSLGDAGGFGQRRGQSFTPSKVKQYSFTFLKRANTGSPTSDVVASIQTVSAGVPTGEIVGTPVTITAAQWDAITNDTEYNVSLPFNPTIGNVYAFVLTPSTQDGSNYRNIGRYGAGGYTAGTGLSFDGTNWATSASDMYFLSKYSKNTINFTVRTDTQEISVTAPTTDGWEDGYEIDTATLGIAPLVLAPGVNNIYYSSNGPATADGTVSPSLQVKITPVLYKIMYTPAYGNAFSLSKRRGVFSL